MATEAENPVETEESPRFVVITPEWESTARYFATALRDHSFQQGANGPVISFIEQVRYLQVTNPDGLEALLTYLKAQPEPKIESGDPDERQAEYDERNPTPDDPMSHEY